MSNRFRRSAAIVAGLAGVVLMVLALAGVLSCDGGEEDRDGADSSFGQVNSVASPVLPPPAVRRYDVGGRPDSISAGAGYVWAADSLDGTLKRINPESKRPISVEVAGFPTDVSAGEDAAWLALGDRGAVQRASGTEGAGEPIEVAGFPFRIAAGEGSVWAMSQTSIEQVDPEAREVRQELELGLDLESIAAGEGAVWVVTTNGKVLKLDSDTGDESASAEVPGGFSVTVGESAVWVLGSETADGSGGTLSRIDTSGSVAGAPVPVARAVDVAAGLEFVWVIEERGLTQLDPESGVPVGGPIPVGSDPRSVTVGQGSVWVTAAGEGAVYRVTP